MPHGNRRRLAIVAMLKEYYSQDQVFLQWGNSAGTQHPEGPISKTKGVVEGYCSLQRSLHMLERYRLHSPSGRTEDSTGLVN